MEENVRFKMSALVITFVLIAGTALTGMVFLGEGSQGMSGDVPVLVYTEGSEELEDLNRRGNVVDHYGRNTLLRVEEEEIYDLKEDYELDLLEHRAEFRVKGYEFDRREGFPDFTSELGFDSVDESEVQEKLTADESELQMGESLGREIYLLQMLGPRNPEWRLELEEMGVDIIGSVHNYGYEVHMSPERAEKVEELEFVEWVGPYQPGFKIAPELTMDLEEKLAEEMQGSEELGEDMLVDSANSQQVSDMSQVDLEETIESSQPNFPDELVVEIIALDGMSTSTLSDIASTVERIESASDVTEGLLVRAVIDSQSDLLDIAQISDVYHIAPYLEPELHEMSSQIVGGGSWHYAPQWDWEDPGPPRRDPETPVEPYRADDPEFPAGPLTAQEGYTGEDVIFSVADTGIGDGTLGDAGHEDFTGRVVSGYDWSSDSTEPGDPWDSHGHGTAVAGVAASDSYHGTGYNFPHEELEWTGIESWEDYYASMGVAPEASIHNSRIANDAGELVIPPDLREVPEQAIQQEPDLFGQTHSWGVVNQHGGYTERTRHIDLSVRDADRDTEEEDPLVISFSAGNDGGRGENTVGEPGGTAKNAISVGGTENYQPESQFLYPSDNADAHWPSASQGWTDDNRVKPDVAGSASNILTNYWYDDPAIDPNYVGIAGTSFSSPAAQGAAAMIAEWYDEHPLVEGRPSPAMVRALLTNTAYDIPEDHDGDGTVDHVPNRYEGWGRMDLMPLVDHDLPEGGPFMMYDGIDEGYEETTLETGEVEKYSVAPMDPDEPLKITLAWDDAAASAGADPTLQNDLRLEVEDPDGNVYRGNAFNETGEEDSTSGFSYPDTEVMSDFDLTEDGYDDVNNILKVYIEEPEPDTHEVRVIGEDIPERANKHLDHANQDFALAVQNSFLTEDGIFLMDNERYSEEDTVEFTVIDEDMTERESVDIDVRSYDESGELKDHLEDVNLRGDKTGIVTGYLDIGPGFEDDDDGLYVEHDFEINATYYDESMEEEKYEEADVDGEPPEAASGVEVDWHDFKSLEHNNITWELSEDDEWEYFEGYRIYRAEAEDGEEPVEEDWKYIETVGPGTTEYIDEDVGRYNYTRHWYDVAAVDDVGNENMTEDPGIEPPAVRLDSPEGSEIWTGGDLEEIEWYAATGGLDSEITIDYSIDSGETWEQIEVLDEDEVDDGEGSYVWEIPEEIEGTNHESHIRIVIEDVDGLTVDGDLESMLGAQGQGNQFDESSELDVPIAPEGLANTSWPQMGQNQQRTGQSPYDTSDNDGVPDWAFEADEGFLSNPTIGPDGTIYIGNMDNNLYAIHPNGTEKWSYETGDSIRESTPALGECPDTEELRVYVGSDDGNVYALDPEDGSEIWTFDEPLGDIYSSPNVGEDGTVYVGSHDTNLYAINPDGTEKWTFTQPQAEVGSSPAIGTNPETGETQIYVGSYDTTLYAVNPEDGSEIWSYEKPTGWTLSVPTVGEDGTIYVGSSDNTLHAVNPNGTEKWTFSTMGDIYGSPLVSDNGTVYVGAYDNNIYAVDPDEGSEIWSFETGADVRRGGAIGAEGTVYYGSADGHLYAIDPIDGSEVWSYEVGEDVRTGPAISEEGILYFGAHDNQVHALVSATNPPSQVLGLEYYTYGDTVEIEWERPDKIPSDEAITHYNVYRDNEFIGEVEETNYVDTDLEKWEEYNYEISAVNSIGEGESSPPLSVQITPPSDVSDSFTLTEYEAHEAYLESPEEGDTWYMNTTEQIDWTIEGGDGENLTHLGLEYSVDGGESWSNITEIEDPDRYGDYEWTIPLEQSMEAVVRLEALDEHGLTVDVESDKYEMIAAEPPENLTVDYVDLKEEVLFHDTMYDGEPEEGYETLEDPEGLNEWSVRDHGSYSEEYSWDMGDAGYEGVEDGGLSRLISPEVEIPEDSTEAEMSFQHWRDFDWRYDGGNMRISIDGEEWSLIEPEEGYPETISEDYDNPLGGEPGWTRSEDWEEVTFDLDEYIGETVQFEWRAGVDSWPVEGDQGWRIDDIEVTAEHPHEGEGYHEDNRLIWDASPDDGAGEDNVVEYNIYRSEYEDELGEKLASLDAEGLEEYRYFDEEVGTADTTTWWYTVRPVIDEIIEVPGEPEWHWLYDAEHRSSSDSSVGVTEPAEWHGGIRLDLSDEIGKEITEVAYYDPELAGDWAQAHVSPDEDGAPAEPWEASSEEYTPEGAGWVELELEEPVEIEGSGQYWIVMEVDDWGDDNYPLATSIPYVEEGGFINLADPFNPDDWDTTEETHPDFNYAWLIEAMIQPETEVLVEEEQGDVSREPLAPHQPVDPDPEDGTAVSVEQHETTELSFEVGHGGSETPMDVSFYESGTDDLIGDASGVYAEESVSVEWDRLPRGERSWYVEVDDGEYSVLSDEWTFMVDPEDPEVELLEPQYGDILGYSDVNVSWEGHDDWSGIEYYEIRLRDYLGWTDVGDIGSILIEDVPDDDHVLDVRATDRAGNQAIDTVEFTVNTEDPVVEITEPQSWDAINEEPVKVGWNGYDYEIEMDYYEVRVEDGVWTYAGLSESFKLSGLEEGENTIQVRGTDEAGNQHVDSVDVIFDSTEPMVDIQSPEEGEVIEQDSLRVDWEAVDIHPHNITQLENYEVRLNDQGWIEPETETPTIYEIGVIDDTEGAGESWVEILEDELPEIYGVEHIDSDDALEDIGAYQAYFVHGLDSDNEDEWFEETDGIGTIYTSQNQGPGTLDQRSEVIEDPESVTQDTDMATWNVTGQHPILDGVAEPGEDILIHEDRWRHGASFTGTEADVYAEANDGDDAFGVDERRQDVLLTAHGLGGSVYSGQYTEEGFEILGNSVEYISSEPDIPVPWLPHSNYTFTDLSDGQHTVYVRATDRAGNQYTESVDFIVDTPEPELEIISPEGGVENLTYYDEFEIEGEVDVGSSVYIDGEEIELDEEGYFSYETILVEGQNVFEVKAEHIDGEVAETEVYALYLPQIPEIRDQIETLEDDIESNRDAIEALEEETERLEEELEYLHVEVDNLEEALDENVTALEYAIEENRTEQVEILEENLTDIQGELDDVNEDIEAIYEELEEIRSEEDDEWWEIPGFTTTLLIAGVILALVVHHKIDYKKENGRGKKT